MEGWLAAGRPDHETALATAWDLLNRARYGADPRPDTPRTGTPDPRVAHLDEVLRRWPHLPTFVTAYARVERFIENTGVVLPPLTA